MIRFRVDGTLYEMLRPGRKLASLLVSRIKVMARLDIAENAYRRMGALRCCWAVGRLTCVSHHAFRTGERVVLRLLDKTGLA